MKYKVVATELTLLNFEVNTESEEEAHLLALVYAVDETFKIVSITEAEEKKGEQER